MQVPNSTPTAIPGRKREDGTTNTCQSSGGGGGCLGNCYNGFFWDPAGAYPNFMNNAVIYGISMAQGSWATNTVGYFGSVRAYTTNGYDYTWVF